MTTPTSLSVFERWRPQAWPFRYEGRIHVDVIAGGIPSDENKTKGWLKSKLAMKDDLLREAVAEVMAERGLSAEEAAEVVAERQNLNGFKREGENLFIEGRQLKAAIKEAVSISVAAGKIKPPNNKKGWGTTNKGLLSFVAEHVHVVEDKLLLHIEHSGKVYPVTEPTGVAQRFVHTWRGNAIQVEEYVQNASFDFTVEADYEFTEEQWALFWLTGQNEGIGASRSQGYGRYTVVKWDQVEAV
jgi:hypothetical protein